MFSHACSVDGLSWGERLMYLTADSVSNRIYSSNLCGTHHFRGNVPYVKGVRLRETSVLSLRLVGRVGGGRTSVGPVIEGGELEDRERDLERIQEVGGW